MYAGVEQELSPSQSLGQGRGKCFKLCGEYGFHFAKNKKKRIQNVFLCDFIRANTWSECMLVFSKSRAPAKALVKDRENVLGSLENKVVIL